MADQGSASHLALRAELKETRRAVQAAGDILNAESYARIQSFFRFTERGEADLNTWLTPEYNGNEYLACVDPNGEKRHTAFDLIEDCRRCLEKEPGFARWFTVEKHPRWGEPVLLPARWLAHSVGLRHGTAQLILHVADTDEKLLVQVRSMRKSASPGRYDLPVAGHVDGLQGYEETLRKETGEEIGLQVELLQDLRCLGGYLDCSLEEENNLDNCEYHRVFSARLDPALVSSLKPQPGEVAALAIFPAEEIHALRAAFPGAFAPGIQQTFDRFLRK